MLRKGLPETRGSCAYSRSRREPLKQLLPIETTLMPAFLHGGPARDLGRCQYLIDTTQINSPICLRQVPRPVTVGSWITRWNKKCTFPVWRTGVS
jgi:hypothetical protein